MPIVSGDIRFFKSINADSDGGAIDTGREITSGVTHNLFTQITGSEQLAGGTEYRKFFMRNQHASLSWLAVKSWINSQPSNATLSMGVGLNSADDDDGLTGNMTAFSASSVVALISDGADTRTCTVVGETTGGVYQTENIVLTGAVEVLGLLTFGKVYNVSVATESATRTVTVRQGAGGTARGTISINRKLCFLWRTGTDIDTEAEGYRFGDIAALGNFALWMRLVWAAGATAGLGFTAVIGANGGS